MKKGGFGRPFFARFAERPSGRGPSQPFAAAHSRARVPTRSPMRARAARERRRQAVEDLADQRRAAIDERRCRAARGSRPPRSWPAPLARRRRRRSRSAQARRRSAERRAPASASTSSNSGRPERPPALAAIARPAASPAARSSCWRRSGRRRRARAHTSTMSSSAAQIEVGRDLDQHRPAPAPPASRASMTRATSSSSASRCCRSRRPGVLGEETLTAK